MSKTWWMTSKESQSYQKVVLELPKLHEEHRKLCRKMKRREITSDEAGRLREVVKLINEKNAVLLKMKDKNPIRPENIIRSLKNKN